MEFSKLLNKPLEMVVQKKRRGIVHYYVIETLANTRHGGDYNTGVSEHHLDKNTEEGKHTGKGV